MIDQKTLKTLEYDKILAMLSKHCVSSCAANAALSLIPEGDAKKTIHNQQLTNEAYALLYKYNIDPVAGHDDISSLLESAKIGATISMGGLLKVGRVIRSARTAQSMLLGSPEEIVKLKNLVRYFIPETALEKIISDSIASEDEMKDSASETLRSLRRRISSCQVRLRDKLNDYTRSSSYSKFLQDNIVTVRNGRFVLPVKSEHRSSVPGLIHDMSGSGSTAFIEPFPIVELNNELCELKSEEREEIERILQAISAMAGERYDNLCHALQICTDIDVIFAKCRFSVELKGVSPDINQKGKINLINSRHPLIDRNSVVPVSISLGDGYNILVITGPNTGGKTVSLKTTGLFCVMAYIGLWLPCSPGSEIAVFDDIFCDIGDEQNIENSLSTFSSHMLNIKRITDRITNNSLVLLDELGGGTDPTEGAALAIGIIKYFELMNVKGIITTHYNDIKNYALVSNKLMNGCMQFDDKTLRPTYKLIIGIAGLSNAINISRNLGLNDFILKNAENALDKSKIEFDLLLKSAEQAKSAALAELEKYEKLNLDISEEKRELIKKREELDRRMEGIRNNARTETKKIVSRSVERADEILDEMKSLIEQADEAALLKAKHLKRQLDDIKYRSDRDDETIETRDLSADEVKIGEKVYIKSLGATGVLKSVPDKKNVIIVAIGGMQVKLNVSDLAKQILPKPATKPLRHADKSRQANTKNADSDRAVTQTEIKVLGQTVADAVEIIEPYILSSESGATIKVVHGKGTGALSRGLHEYFRTNSKVLSYRFGRYGEGDTGVTIIEIR